MKEKIKEEDKIGLVCQACGYDALIGSLRELVSRLMFTVHFQDNPDIVVCQECHDYCCKDFKTFSLTKFEELKKRKLTKS